MTVDLPPSPPANVESIAVAAAPFQIQLDGALFFKAQYAKGNKLFKESIGIPDTATFETAVILNARKDDVVLRTRLTSMTPIRPDGQSIRFDASLLEAAWDLYPTDQIDIRLGKTFLNWDPGLATQPNGFFQGQPDFADIADFEHRLEGVLLASVTYAADLFDITFVAGEVADDPRLGFDQPGRQAAVRVVRDFEMVTLAVISRITDTDDIGFGMTASATFSDDVTGQLSVFSSKLATRAVVGGSVFVKEGVIVAIELSYDGLNATDTPFITLTSPRTFVDVRVGRMDFDLGWSVSLRHSLEDESYLLTGAFVNSLTQRIQLRFEAGKFSNRDTGLFGRAPIENFASVSLRAVF